MSRKKTKADEFGAMADVHKILVNFDSHARARIVASVEGKISAEAPKKRVRKVKAAPAQGEVVILPPISLAGVVTNAMLGVEDKSIQ